MDKQNFKRIIATIYPARYQRGLIILNYHSVHPDNIFSTSPKDFEAQMLYLKNNYEIIPLSDLNESDFSFLSLDQIKVAITFDDGYEDNYLYAYPILKKLDLPATIFLTTDYIFRNIDITKNWIYYKDLRPLKIEQIKEMQTSKIAFGSHGQTHLPTSALSPQAFASELAASQQEIMGNLHFKATSFAFPFGQKKDCARIDPAIFASNGYLTACTTDWGINLKQADKRRLKRIRIDYFDSLDDFKNKLLGKWDFVKYFQSIKNIL